MRSANHPLRTEVRVALERELVEVGVGGRVDSTTLDLTFDNPMEARRLAEVLREARCSK